MNQEEILQRMKEKLPEDVVLASDLFRDQMTLTVKSENILDVGRLAMKDPRLDFNFLSFVGGVDRHPAKPRFEVVYQLYSTTRRHRFRIKCLLEEPAEGLPAIDSVVSLWPTADWHERETSEMFGIIFNNHPDPRKLLLPDHWKVYPLRKDFPLEGSEKDTPDLPS
jgi:NADH-quinone oxidoreductase subunit C